MKNCSKYLLTLLSLLLFGLIVSCGQADAPVESAEQVEETTDSETEETETAFDPSTMIEMGDKVPLPIKPETESFDYSIFSDEKAISKMISIEFVDDDSTVREFSFSKFMDPETEMCFYNHTKTDRTSLDAAEIDVSFDEIVNYMQQNVKTLPNPMFFDYVPLRTMDDINQYAAEKEKLSVIIMLYVHKEDASNTSEEDTENPTAVFKYYGLVKGQEIPANLKTLENFLTRKLEASTEAFAKELEEQQAVLEKQNKTTSKKKKKKKK